MFRLVPFALLFLVGCSSATEPARAQKSAPLESAAHLLVTLELSGGKLSVADKTLVEQALPRVRVPEQRDWVVELRNTRGEKIFEAQLPKQDVVRGEFGGNGTIDGSHLPLERAVFQVRTPRVRATLLLFERRGDELMELGRAELVP